MVEPQCCLDTEAEGKVLTSAGDSTLGIQSLLLLRVFYNLISHFF
jgi:hypothetical protein